MRKPRVENKYNLKPKEVQYMRVLDRERIKQEPFWRNDVVQAWCLSEIAGEQKFCDENQYWIGIYDEDAKAYAGKIRLSCTSYGGMCGYNFKEFFNPKEIERDIDLEIQEKLLSRLNWLLDEKILGF